MADEEFKVKKERDPIMMVCFVVFLLTTCAIIGASLYNNHVKADDTVAINGNTVVVNYTGTYYDYLGNEHAVVFDTNQWSIANDDDIAKSNGFTLKDEKNYTTLSFKVGGTDVLTGFGNAVIGHKVGDKIKVVIPAGEGYNAADTGATISSTDVQTVPLTETLTLAQFKSIYGYELKGHEEIAESVYGWPASASYNTSNNTVTMVYRPVANTSYEMVDNDFGKVTLNVTSVSNNISYTYTVSDYTVVSQDGNNKEIQMIMLDMGTKKWYINSVTDTNNDGTAESFTYKTTEERYNQDLYFEIEIVSIS